jgi:hypothetical protein
VESGSDQTAYCALTRKELFCGVWFVVCGLIPDEAHATRDWWSVVLPYSTKASSDGFCFRNASMNPSISPSKTPLTLAVSKPVL